MIKMLEGEGYNPTHQHLYRKSISIRYQQNFLIKMGKMGRKIFHHCTGISGV